MKKIAIYGDNRQEEATKVRIACRGVILSQDKIFLVHETNIDQWMLPGGGLEGDETLEGCCIRELAEETGMVVKPEKHYLTIDEYYGEWLFTSHYFICTPQGETERHLTDLETKLGLEPEWISLEEAVRIFSEHQKYAETDEMRSGAYLREYSALEALR